VTHAHWAFLLVPLSCCAGSGRDPAEVLKQVTAKVRARDAGLPNYTCVETVQREYYMPRGSTLPRACGTLMELRGHRPFDLVLRHVMTDRLRLDVTMSDRGEIYSWVGASHFEDTTIDHLVRAGPINTGAFGGFLSVVFDKDVQQFRFERNVTVDGRSLMEFSFDVPKEKSSYRVKAGNSFVRTAYSGTFQADPETSELVRMTVNSGELPLATGTCQSSTAMEFALVQIGDGEFLLPKQGKQRYLGTAGEEVENTTTFAGCREYKGESTVTFFPPPEPANGMGTSGVPGKADPLPARLPFEFELSTPILLDRAAAGDAFSGRLVGALRDSRGTALAPAHAVVEGRLLRVQVLHGAREGAVLVLKLRTVEVRGVKIPLEAVRDWTQMRPEKGGSLPILLPQPGEENSGVFPLPGGRAGLKAGFRSQWITMGGAR